MAHETVIHRVDAELSCGQSSPIDPDLAVDGVDEVLAIFLAGDWSDEPADECQGQRIAVATGGLAWEVELLRDTINVVNVAAPQDGSDAEVGGDPGAVLLWLWGRGSASRLAQGGDVSVLQLLRGRLKLATK
jgi:hypothetical protein